MSTSSQSPHSDGPNQGAKTLPDEPGGLAQLLDIEVVEATPERVTATMPVTPDLHQPFGLMHGGVSAVLAESVASIGGYLAAPPDHMAVGIEINANHIRSMREGRLTGTATPLHTGRTTHVWEVKIHDEADRLICASRCTLAIVEQTDAPSAA